MATSLNSDKHDAMDAVILLYAQLTQPVTADAVSKHLKNDPLFHEVPEAVFVKAFSRLEKQQYLWRTAANNYIVTPKAEPLIRLAIKHRRRDKIRLFSLNKMRYNNA